MILKQNTFNSESMTAKEQNKIIRIIKRAKTLNRIVKAICAEKIGEGVFRDVYVLKQNPKYVVKVERDMSKAIFANASEWRNYCNNRDWKLVKGWLAPCEMINETGELLIQKRVSWEGKRRKDYPKYIPDIFTDTKLTNFGWIGKKFVCCDYSFFVLGTKGKMRFAKWWGSLK
jgi:predicted Rdx family selenoprotein